MNPSDAKVYRELFPEQFNSRHHSERDAELVEAKAEIERLRKEGGRLMDAQRDYECPVLGDKELVSAVISELREQLHMAHRSAGDVLSEASSTPESEGKQT